MYNDMWISGAYMMKLFQVTLVRWFEAHHMVFLGHCSRLKTRVEGYFINHFQISQPAHPDPVLHTSLLLLHPSTSVQLMCPTNRIYGQSALRMCNDNDRGARLITSSVLASLLGEVVVILGFSQWMDRAVIFSRSKFKTKCSLFLSCLLLQWALVCASSASGADFPRLVTYRPKDVDRSTHDGVFVLSCKWKCVL